MRVTNCPRCPSLRGFPEPGTFSFRTGEVLRKPGGVGLPMCDNLSSRCQLNKAGRAVSWALLIRVSLVEMPCIYPSSSLKFLWERD